jgi:hypothetical protein
MPCHDHRDCRVKPGNDELRVIARSPCDEAIQGGLHWALDCFAAARNDELYRSRDAIRTRVIVAP